MPLVMLLMRLFTAWLIWREVLEGLLEPESAVELVDLLEVTLD